MREEYERRAKDAANAVAKMTPGSNGKDVVARMREILGV
jgi:hypothetical protein